MYGGYGKVKTTRGHEHNYLAMKFDFYDKDKANIDTIDYINEME